MTAREKLQEVLIGSYNLEFEHVEVIKCGISLTEFDETIYSSRWFAWRYNGNT